MVTFMGDVLISKGAEAHIYLTKFFDMKAIKKVRVKKLYRVPSIDMAIRKMRTRREAKLLSQVKKIGVPAPVIYDLILSEYTIIMEYVKGKLLKDLLISHSLSPIEEKEYFKRIGEFVGRMHSSDIIHGDLTTSNIIITPSGKIVFIDFGLGEFTSSIEDKGVELRVFYTALCSTHPDRADDLFEAFLDGYEHSYDLARKVISKFSEISLRGRYVAKRREKRKFMSP